MPPKTSKKKVAWKKGGHICLCGMCDKIVMKSRRQSIKAAAHLVFHTCEVLVSGAIALSAAVVLTAAAFSAAAVHTAASIVAHVAHRAEVCSARVLDTVGHKVDEFELMCTNNK